MSWVTVAFIAFTAALAYWQVRSHASEQGGGDSEKRRCPRCGAPVPSVARKCPACGVPQQIFELVAAPSLAAPTADEGAGQTLRAVVRRDTCVGCGTCVAACPEPGAITLRGKLAVVDPALCQGHGECSRACPVGAIALGSGAAVNRVAVPFVDANFESNIPGLYIVGELGGRGLIKNAINEGKLAVEHIGHVLRPGSMVAARGAPRAGNETPAARAGGERGRVKWEEGEGEGEGEGSARIVDVAIVGSGPAGLSAGLQALKLGLDYVVLEQGTLSDTVRKYPRHKLLMAEPVRVPLYGDLWVADSSKETLLAIWEKVVANTGLAVRTGQKVEQIERAESGFILRTPNAEYRARRVVLGMGRRGTPRRLGVPGEDAAKVLYDIVEMEAFRGRRVLVVGGGDSAVESALGLANQVGTEVTLSYRGERLARIKDRNREKLDRAVAAGSVRPLFNSQVREIRADVVVMDLPTGSRIVPNDYVVIRIGGEAPYALLERLGVRIVHKDVPVPQETADVG